MAATVLIVANDPVTTADLATPFNKKEFSVLAAHSGRQALVQAKTHLPDVVIVDLSSPRLNGKRVCRQLRSESHAIIFALATNPNRVESLNGVTQVLPKSTTAKRLVQRVRTALENRPPRELRAANLTLDMERRRVTRGSRTHKLTPKEFELLKLFMERCDQLVSRQVLMQEIWNTDYLGDTRTLDVHIRWLREKIEDDASRPTRLVTIRGQGYRLQGK